MGGVALRRERGASTAYYKGGYIIIERSSYLACVA